MFLLIWTRKLYKTLSADASPSAIAMGIAFGITLGFIPLLSGLGIVFMLAMLVFRIQLSAAFLALGLSKSLYALGLWRLFMPVGELVLEPESLHGFWTWFLNLPAVAWLDLDRIAVTGGAVVGILLGAILFLPVRQTVVGYRRFVHEKVSTNKWFNRATSWWFVKLLRFIFIGTKVAS